MKKITKLQKLWINLKVSGPGVAVRIVSEFDAHLSGRGGSIIGTIGLGLTGLIKILINIGAVSS